MKKIAVNCSSETGGRVTVGSLNLKAHTLVCVEGGRYNLGLFIQEKHILQK